MGFDEWLTDRMDLYKGVRDSAGSPGLTGLYEGIIEGLKMAREEYRSRQRLKEVASRASPEVVPNPEVLKPDEEPPCVMMTEDYKCGIDGDLCYRYYLGAVEATCMRYEPREAGASKTGGC